MSDFKDIFGDITVAEILHNMRSMLVVTAHIEQALNALCQMDDGSVGAPGSPGNIQAAAKAEAIASVVKARETTNQQALQLYERIYNDMIRFAAGETQKE